MKPRVNLSLVLIIAFVFAAVRAEAAAKREAGGFFDLGDMTLHVYAAPLENGGRPEAFLAVYHDASYIDKQTSWLWWQQFAGVLVEVLLIALLTLLIVRWSVTGPIALTARWMKELRTRGGSARRVARSAAGRSLFCAL